MENYYVCGCKKVTEEDLRNAIKNRAKTFEELQSVTNIGTGCGECLESNQKLVAELLAK